MVLYPKMKRGNLMRAKVITCIVLGFGLGLFSLSFLLIFAMDALWFQAFMMLILLGIAVMLFLYSGRLMDKMTKMEEALKAQGNRVSAILVHFAPDGSASKQRVGLQAVVQYIRTDGREVQRETRLSIRHGIEPKLYKGMVLPFIYNDEAPDQLWLDGELDYDMLEWSAQQSANIHPKQ